MCGLVRFAALRCPHIRISCTLFIDDFPRSLVSEERHCYLSGEYERPNRRRNLAQRCAASRAKITICLEFRDGRLRSRERDTLKLSGYALKTISFVTST